jgi:hypothetical protein
MLCKELKKNKNFCGIYGAAAAFKLQKLPTAAHTDSKAAVTVQFVNKSQKFCGVASTQLVRVCIK